MGADMVPSTCDHPTLRRPGTVALCAPPRPGVIWHRKVLSFGTVSLLGTPAPGSDSIDTTLNSNRLLASPL